MFHLAEKRFRGVSSRGEQKPCELLVEQPLCEKRMDLAGWPEHSPRNVAHPPGEHLIKRRLQWNCVRTQSPRYLETDEGSCHCCHSSRIMCSHCSRSSHVPGSMSPSRRALHSIGGATVREHREDRECHWGTREVQPPPAPTPGCSPPVLKYRDLHDLRIPELNLKLRDIPLKRMEMEMTKGNQEGLALKNPDDGLPSDSRKGEFSDRSAARKILMQFLSVSRAEK